MMKGEIYLKNVKDYSIVGFKRENKPIGFVFENVKGIMSSKMEDGTSIPDEIVKRTEKLRF